MRANDIIIDTSSSECIQKQTTTWKQIECVIRENLEQFENGRKFCAYCGQKEDYLQINENRLILGRCYGCQMVYYCSQEHQNADWLDYHMPKCAELEWVALGELIQSIPANPALTNIGMYWPDNYLPHTWTDWFEIRPDLVQIAKQTAIILEQNQQVKLILNKFNRREPSNSDLVDGLLAAVTDSITYALTIGNCLIKTGINPNIKPVCVHLLHPPNELIDDLDCLNAADQLEIDRSIKKKFYELCNMFPLNKGIEIVFITLKQTNNLDWTKLLKSPFMKTQLHKSLPLNDKNLYISAWQGSYSNYIKYVCEIEGYSHPDLVVSFHPSFTSSPHKLINEWTDDLKIILTNNFPCLFTFYDKEEKQKAFNILNAFQSNFICVQSNQFSSLMLKQMQAKPNHVYASNSFSIVIKGFINVENDLRYQHQAHLGIINENSSVATAFNTKDTRQRSKNIHDLLSFHNQNSNILIDTQSMYESNSVFHNDACMQTLGLEEPENASLRHINGKLQINKSSIYSKINSETLIKMNNERYNLPVLDFSAKKLQQQHNYSVNYYQQQQQQQIIDDNELKVNFRPSNFLCKNNFIMPNQNNNYYNQQNQFYHSKLLIQPVINSQQQHEALVVCTPSTPIIQTRSRSRPANYSSPIKTTSLAVIPSNTKEEETTTSQPPPPLKPRIATNTITNVEPVINNINNNNNNDILDLNSIPTTKPRMRPTRIYEKYTNTQSPNIVESQICQIVSNNPMPKPRNSIHLTDNKLELNLNNENESEQMSNIKPNDDNEPKLSFKANLLKKSREHKEEFLTMSPSSSSSSSSSPCSSTSALSMSSSPRSHEENTNQINNANSTSSASSSSSCSQAIMSSSSNSSFNSSSAKTNSGFVSQMKNIFESQQQHQQHHHHYHIEFKKKQINHERDLNSYEATQTIKKPIPVITTKTIEKEDQSSKLEMKEEIKTQTQTENTQTQSEYMNVSNRYLSYLKLKQQQKQETTRFSPPCSPPPLPPLPPSSPPLSRSPSPISSSPFKPTNDKLVTKIISQPLNKNNNNTLTTMTTTTTTTTMISSSIINPTSSSNPSSRLLSSSPVNTPVKVTKSEFRILSNNNNNSSITNHSDRSASLSGKSMSSLSQSNNNLNFNNRVMLTHIPDSVDVVQFQYEGQRRVVVPGYMTSADILRNMLLNSNNMNDSTNADGALDPSKAPIIIQRQTTTAMSLKEKLLLQNKNENSEFQSYNYRQHSLEPYQQKPPQPPTPTYQLTESVPVKQIKIDDDDDLDKKFARNRSRSMSGIVTLDLTSTQTTQIIDIDFDYESKSVPPEPPINQNPESARASSYITQPQSESYYAVANPKPREIKPSIRINQLIANNNSNLINGSTKSGNSRRIPSHQRQSVTGSFDPNDFDSFDEEEVEEEEEEEQQQQQDYIITNNFNDYETKSISNANNNKNSSQMAHIQIESLDKIRESAILEQKIEQDRLKQQMNLVQFDPDDFDSFNEDEDEEIELKQEKLPIIQLDTANQNEEKNYLPTNEINSKQEFLNNRNKLEAMFKKNENYMESKVTTQQPILKEIPALKVETKIVVNDLNKIEPVYNESNEYASNNNNNNNSKSNNSGGFFRSALDRISSRSSKSKSGSKTRSSSVPLRNLISSNLELATEIPEQSTPVIKQAPQPQQRSRINEASSSMPKSEQTNLVANMKTLQLMNKMQSEYDEKQKRRKLRREQKSKETEKLPPKSPKASNDRKFLSSIMNTLFSSSNNLNTNDSTSSSNNESKSALQKNEAKRLSLRKLKAKDKAKKKTDGYSDDEMQKQEMKSSNRSLNLIQNSNHYNDEEEEDEDEYGRQPVNFPRSTSFDTGSLSKLTSVQFQPTSIGTASINSRFGKIKNETDKPKDENNKENLMKQLKAELDEEIKDRRMIELKNNIINGGSTGGSTSSGSSDCYNQYDAKSLSLNRKSLKDSNQIRTNDNETSQNNRKIRSKSVTFLDEISTDDEIVSMSNSPQISTHHKQQNVTLQYSTLKPQHRTNNYQQQQLQQQQQHFIDETNNFNTPSSARKTKTNVKTGDVRLMCGALTGVGPIRSIMKKSAADLSLTLNIPSTSSKSNSYETNNNSNRLPSIQLNGDYDEENNYEYRQQQNNNSKMIKSQTQPNIAKRRDLMQSDL